MATELRRWLQKHPHPHSLRCLDVDGEVDHEVKLGVMRSKWKDAESAIGSTTARVEALDSEGRLLRALDFQVEGAEQAATGRTERTQEIADIARIISQACDQAVLRNREAHEAGMAVTTQLLAMLTQRLAGLENAWHKLIMSQQEQAREDDSPVTALLGAALQAELGKGKTNGA